MAERIHQKLRTRRALLEAAREILDGGSTPTIAEVAARAQVSRATTYRYFPTRDALLEELPLDLDWQAVAEDLWQDDRSGSPVDRVGELRAAFYEFSLRNEPQFRLYLRNWFDRWLRRSESEAAATRGARREPLIERALGPLVRELDPRTLEKLKIALATMMGFESMIVLHDVLGLERDRAEAAMDWAVRTLVRAAAAEGTLPRRTPDPSSANT